MTTEKVFLNPFSLELASIEIFRFVFYLKPEGNDPLNRKGSFKILYLHSLFRYLCSYIPKCKQTKKSNKKLTGNSAILKYIFSICRHEICSWNITPHKVRSLHRRTRPADPGGKTVLSVVRDTHLPGTQNPPGRTVGRHDAARVSDGGSKKNKTGSHSGNAF